MTWSPDGDFGASAFDTFSSIFQTYPASGQTEVDFYSIIRWPFEPVIPGTVFPLGTAAFKGSILPICDPTRNLGTLFLEAPCGGSDTTNVIYVPSSAYEDEGRIANPSCSLITRTGTSIDRNFGCFVASYAFSNLPNPYFDTPVLDPPSQYRPTIGSVSPELIIETTTYETYSYGYANAIENLNGSTAVHGSQVGTDQFACPPGVPASFCVYATDTRILGTAPYLPF